MPRSRDQRLIHFRSSFNQGEHRPQVVVTASQAALPENYTEHLFSKSLSASLQVHAQESIDMLSFRSNAGTSMHRQKRWNEARRLHQYVYEKRRDILGAIHHETLKSKANLAIAIHELGAHQQAEDMCRDVVSILERSVEVTHPDILKTYINLANIVFDQGRFIEAEAIVRDALPLMIDRYGLKHCKTLIALEFRATLLHHMGALAIALAIATQLVALRTELMRCSGFDAHLQRNICHVVELETEIEEKGFLQLAS